MSLAVPMPVPLGLLEALAAEVPEEPAARAADPHRNGHAGYNHRLKVEDWLRDRRVAYRVKPTKASGNRTVYLIPCPFDPAHGADRETAVMQDPAGQMSATCMHNSCSGRGWQDFKAKIGPPDPGHYDPPLSATIKVNKKKPTTGPAPDGAEPGAEVTASPFVQVTRDHFRERYKPVYRSGTAVWSETESGLVKPGDALYAPDEALIGKLAAAGEALTDKHGSLDREALAKRFWVLGKIAWREVLDGLRREEDQDEQQGTIENAEEEFRHLLRQCLFAEATFTVKVTEQVHVEGKLKNVERERPEKKQLIDWARQWAKAGEWKRVRSALLWCRVDEQGTLCLALRCELANSYGPRQLKAMTHRTFARLCGLYGVGLASEDHRPGGCRVVVLNPVFVATLETTLPLCLAGSPRARAREENCVTTAQEGESAEPERS